MFKRSAAIIILLMSEAERIPYSSTTKTGLFSAGGPQPEVAVFTMCRHIQHLLERVVQSCGSTYRAEVSSAFRSSNFKIDKRFNNSACLFL
ncbi:alpha-alpha superhelix protein [Ranid herpesvirus 3]|uniref:Alpha-alpha superhelix protein n=1 Tax=Ranid herpesvirus 3 TaxID=1987509 RepID=A0A1X9T596_9VIRU|nr:alpha-alpha superhelix protein [Ranid herpesvirus 3]ARR28874.1 alpha-alpha superhelix protein [Ranid herpesvirus 3]